MDRAGGQRPAEPDQVRAASYLQVVLDSPPTEADLARVRALHGRVAAYAKANGYLIVAYHHDGAAGQVERGAFRRLLDDLRDGLVSHVLVASETAIADPPCNRNAVAMLIADLGGTLVICDASPNRF